MENDKIMNSITNPNDRQVGGDHYKTLTIEPWVAMESWLTLEEFRGFLKGNAIKYLARANSGKGSPDENLKKAKHYMDKLEEVMNANSAPINTPTTNPEGAAPNT